MKYKISKRIWPSCKRNHERSQSGREKINNEKVKAILNIFEKQIQFHHIDIFWSEIENMKNLFLNSSYETKQSRKNRKNYYHL